MATKDIPAIEAVTVNGTGTVTMDIDRQRIAAVRTLEALGYTYRGGECLAPAGAAATPLSLMAKADAMHGALMRRADALAGCAEGSAEETELKAIVHAIEAYEGKRWPLGKDPNVPRGKG